MEDDFDIDVFTKQLAESHPELIQGIEGTSDSEDFETDEFERNLVEDCPELAIKLCELDEKVVKEEQDKMVSKKQQARERQVRLESMMTVGRSVVEKRAETYHEKALKIEGPMELLANAVKNGNRLEVRTRCAVRMDRVFEGIPITFDEHFNLVMSNTTETVLRGRKSKKEVGNRNRLQELLPEFLRWKEGGHWPIPIGSNRLVEHRYHRTCFIKGDSVVLLRTLP